MKCSLLERTDDGSIIEYTGAKEKVEKKSSALKNFSVTTT